MLLLAYFIFHWKFVLPGSYLLHITITSYKVNFKHIIAKTDEQRGKGEHDWEEAGKWRKRAFLLGTVSSECIKSVLFISKKLDMNVISLCNFYLVEETFVRNDTSFSVHPLENPSSEDLTRLMQSPLHYYLGRVGVL